MNNTMPMKKATRQKRVGDDSKARSLQRFYFTPKDLEDNIAWSSASSEARGVIWTLMLAAWRLSTLPAALSDLARVTPCTIEELERTREQWEPWFTSVARRAVMKCKWIESRRLDAQERYDKHASAQAVSAKGRREKGFSDLQRTRDASATQDLGTRTKILNKKEEEEERSPPDGGQSESLSPSGNAGTRKRWVSLCKQERGGELRPWWSFLGKMAKEFGDAEVDRALAGCLELPELPDDPRAWVHRRLKQTQQYKAPESFPEHECWRREHAEAGCRECCKQANREALVDGKKLPYPNVK